MIKKNTSTTEKKTDIILVYLKTDADTMWLSMSQVNDTYDIHTSCCSISFKNPKLFRAAVNNRCELIGEKYFCTPFSFFSYFGLQEAKSYCT